MDSGSEGATFKVASFYCDTLFALIVDDEVIPIYYQSGGGYGGAAFMEAFLNGETLKPDSEMIQGLPEADNCTELCEVTWGIPPDFRN